MEKQDRLEKKEEGLMTILVILVAILFIVSTISLSNTLEEDINYCELYANKSHIDIEYVDGEKYVLFEDELVLESRVKEDCLK